MKNIRFFLSENFQFLEVKFSIYMNRRVFVMLYLEDAVVDQVNIVFLERKIETFSNLLNPLYFAFI